MIITLSMHLSDHNAVISVVPVPQDMTRSVTKSWKVQAASIEAAAQLVLYSTDVSNEHGMCLR